MIDINTEIPDCGKPLDCFAINISTDSYKVNECADSFITFDLVSNPTDGIEFSISLNDADDVNLFNLTFVFKTVPSASNHILIGSTLEDTGNNMLAKLVSTAAIIGNCQVSGEYDGGLTPKFHFAITYICAKGTFDLTQPVLGGLPPISVPVVTIAATELSFEPNFKVEALVVDCPFSIRPAYSTLVNGIEIYFDKQQNATVNLANRLSPFVKTAKPDIDNTLQYLEDYQRRIQIVFTENIDGTAGSSASTNEFYLRNTRESVSCYGFYNEFDLTLCRIQAAFAYFFVKYPDTATIKIKDENGDELFSSYANLPGLWALNVSYDYLVAEGIIPEGTPTITLELRETYGGGFDLYTMDVFYECNCEGDKSFLFMTDRGIFEPIVLREINDKIKITKSLYTECDDCNTGTNIFNVDSSYTYTFVSPRIADITTALKYSKFIKSRKIYGLSNGLLIEAFDEGGNYEFRLDSVNEFTIDIKKNS